MTTAPLSLPRRFFHGWLRIVRHLLPPTFYFFVAFNVISMTTDLLVRSTWFDATNFVLASMLALVVGKIVDGFRRNTENLVAECCFYPADKIPFFLLEILQPGVP